MTSRISRVSHPSPEHTCYCEQVHKRNVVITKAAGNVWSFRLVLMFRFRWLPGAPHMVLSIIILRLWKRIWSFCDAVEPFIQCESVFNRQASLMRSDQGLVMASWIRWKNMAALNCHMSLFIWIGLYINLLINGCTEKTSCQAANDFQAQTWVVASG